jgi:hypothetical protein
MRTLAGKAGYPLPLHNPKERAMAVQVTEVQKALKGADYPASRDDLVSLAESNGADGEVVDALREMHGDAFDSPADVMKGVAGALGEG